MFNIGDKVMAKKNTPYGITDNGWLGYVVNDFGDGEIRVRSIDGSSEYNVEEKYFVLCKEKEENKMDVDKIITSEERESLLRDMERLLDEYDYDYTEYALNKIIDTWAENKSDLITAFKKHPNYLEGKFMIVFSHNFDRAVDINVIRYFKTWLSCDDTAIGVREYMPEDMRKEVQTRGKRYPDNIFNFFAALDGVTSQYITSETAAKVNEICPNIRAVEGQKMSRIVNKVCAYIGINKLPDYNKEFAKYADAINPLQITRHTILSVNPLDYLTMSFGNSWASCHTIDKTNKRGMPNSYQGMYSSGTISYMLDEPSIVFYTVDASYNGNEFWHEPKINRQMFHWGEDKLIQGRLYPQDNDGDGNVYTPYREIVQKIMSELFNFPNLWTVSKGTEAAGKYIYSEGTHYRDYDNFNNCTLSRPKESENNNYITVGHAPICIKCGNEHDTNDNICCCPHHVCNHCGCVIEDEDDVIWIDDESYCSDCATWCDSCETYFVGEGTRVSNGDVVCDDCLEYYYRQCRECGEYYREGDVRYVESVEDYVCDECFEENYSFCDDCDEAFRSEDLTEHNGRWLCDDCLEEEEAREKETQVDEAV